MQRRYVFGPGADEPLVWYEGGIGTTDRRWFHQDERGSVVGLSNNSGSSIGINAYDEYGAPASTPIARFAFTGQAWLPKIGQYYYKARVYAPSLGRFMQSDPVGYADGMNMYAYVGGDPINAIDPSGMEGSGPDNFGDQNSGHFRDFTNSPFKFHDPEHRKKDVAPTTPWSGVMGACTTYSCLPVTNNRPMGTKEFVILSFAVAGPLALAGGLSLEPQQQVVQWSQRASRRLEK